METQNDNQDPSESDPKPRKFSMFLKLIFRITGIDEETMAKCPKHDVDNVRALGELLIASFLWQTMLLALISHRLFAAPGEVRPELLLGAAGIGLFVLLIDSYIFYRSGFEISGIDELRRGGLEVGGGHGPASKIGYLAARIVLSVGFAQLTAIFVALIIFAADTDSRINSTYQNANARLRTDITAIVDADIQRADVAVKTQAARVDSLSSQISTLRQHDIDPTSGSPQIQQAQEEIGQLIQDKTKADDAVIAAQNFATMELGGVKVAPGNSGIAGNGPRYKAATEAVENAKRHAQDVATSLDAARTRLANLHKELALSSVSEQQRSHGELPGYEATLTAEEAKLANLKAQLDGLIKGRPDAIRKAIESAPDYVPLNDGFLAQLIALEHIADEDHKIATVILLIDVVSFGLELAAVLAKVSSYVPMKYSALLAANSYAAVVRIVDDLMAELNRAPATGNEIEFAPPPPPANDNERNGGSSSGSDPFSDLDNPQPQPAKRPRGRPRKHPIHNRLIKSARRKSG
jgi:Domain of unknown function (DUF4407)